MVFEPIINTDQYYYSENVKWETKEDSSKPEPYSFKRLNELRRDSKNAYSGFSHDYLARSARQVDLLDKEKLED